MLYLGAFEVEKSIEEGSRGVGRQMVALSKSRTRRAAFELKRLEAFVSQR